MKLTITQLRRIIKEEVSRCLKEQAEVVPIGFKRLPKGYIADLAEYGGLEEAEEIASMLGKPLSKCLSITSEHPRFNALMSTFVASGAPRSGEMGEITMGTYMDQPAVLVQDPQMDAIWI